VRESAGRILRLIARVGAFDDPLIPEERAVDRPEHRALIRRAAAESMVLLKNDGLLPLDLSVGKIAVIGPNASEARIMGGGSAQLNPHYSVSPWQGPIAARGGESGLTFAEGCTNNRLQPLIHGRVTTEYFGSLDLSGPVLATKTSDGSEMMWIGPPAPGADPASFSARLTTSYTASEGGEHVFGLLSAGRSRLFVEGAPVIDAWTAWRRGANYFGEASDEAFGSVNLAGGQAVEVVVEFSTVAPSIHSIRAVRFGASRPTGDAEIAEAAKAAADADVALVFVGRNGEWDTEGLDLPDIRLPGRQDELVARVAAANPRTVVVLQTGGPVEMPWLDQVAAVVQAWYPGQECGNAIADVLFGAAAPGGRLPQTFPRRMSDNPTATDDPVTYPGRDGEVEYREGVLVGYRHYDAAGIAPLFPFGHGLSYTRFAWGPPQLDAERLAPGAELTVSVDVTNTGTRRGTEVVQVYVGREADGAGRLEKELKAFAKVALDPGETKTVSLRLPPRAFAHFDEGAHRWIARAGRYAILVGASSQDIRGTMHADLTGDWQA
jgi:beta-glucosidase